jgi:hypothetical protein
VAADQEELQRALTASREATPVIVLSDDEWSRRRRSRSPDEYLGPNCCRIVLEF